LEPNWSQIGAKLEPNQSQIRAESQSNLGRKQCWQIVLEFAPKIVLWTGTKKNCLHFVAGFLKNSRIWIPSTLMLVVDTASPRALMALQV
jgi:hypothetical protein